MTAKDPFLEGTFWDKFWRPIRSRALLFTPEKVSSALKTQAPQQAKKRFGVYQKACFQAKKKENTYTPKSLQGVCGGPLRAVLVHRFWPPTEKPRERNSGEILRSHAAKIWRNVFADFRPSISRKSGRKKFHEKSSTNSTSNETKFFHSETLGAWGHNIMRYQLVFFLP